MELYLNLINIFMWTVVGLCNVTGMLIVTNPQRTITHSGVSSIFQDTVLVAAFIREQNSSTSVVKHTNYKCSLSCGFLNNCLVKLLQHQSNLKAQTCSGLPFLSVIHPPPPRTGSVAQPRNLPHGLRTAACRWCWPWSPASKSDYYNAYLK